MLTWVYRWLLPGLLATMLLVTGCTGQRTASSTATDANTSPTETATAASETTSPTGSPTSGATSPFGNLSRLDGTATVELLVKGSPIVIEVNGTDAPITAGNFIDLVNRGTYNGTAFHRVVREPQPFVVQGGDPQSVDPKFPIARLGTGSFLDPTTSQPRYIPLEIKPSGATEPIYSQTLKTAGINTPPQLRHTRGAVAMARSSFPDSASAQFYVALADLAFLDGDYAVFGYVTTGMEVVDQIQEGDRITSAKVLTGAENLRSGG